MSQILTNSQSIHMSALDPTVVDAWPASSFERQLAVIEDAIRRTYAAGHDKLIYLSLPEPAVNCIAPRATPSLGLTPVSNGRAYEFTFKDSLPHRIWETLRARNLEPCLLDRSTETVELAVLRWQRFTYAGEPVDVVPEQILTEYSSCVFGYSLVARIERTMPQNVELARELMQLLEEQQGQPQANSDSTDLSRESFK